MIDPNNNNGNNWEKWFHRTLRSLPDRPAPKNLIQGVLEKIAARRVAAWWKRSWFEWHPALRVASTALFCGVFLSAYWFQDTLGLLARQWFAVWMEHSTCLKATLALGECFANIGQYLFASVKTPFLIIAGAVALGLYLAVIAVGGLFCKVAGEQPTS